MAGIIRYLSPVLVCSTALRAQPQKNTHAKKSDPTMRTKKKRWCKPEKLQRAFKAYVSFDQIEGLTPSILPASIVAALPEQIDEKNVYAVLNASTTYVENCSNCPQYGVPVSRLIRGHLFPGSCFK